MKINEVINPTKHNNRAKRRKNRPLAAI